MTDRPSDVVLAHFGVKGMRWGKRKDRVYTDRDRTRDVGAYGSKGAARIEKRIAEGRTVGSARRREYGRQTSQVAGIAAVGLGITALPALLVAAQAAGDQRVINSRTKAGAKAAADLLADKGLTNYKTIVLR